MQTILEHYKEAPPRCPAMEPVHLFNNFVKACLVSAFFKPCGQVLDMPCGRGGDLKKFRENKAGFYVGVDVVPERVREAEERYRGIKCFFPALFEVGDFTSPLSYSSRFDLVSCQFALHYAWSSESSARQVLRNAARHLKDGGVFVLTFPDWEAIVARLFRMIDVHDPHNYAVEVDGGYLYRIGGPHHYLEFRSPLRFHDFMQSLQTEPFGQRYVYYQAGSVEGLEEFVVEPRTLEAMCAEEGFRVVNDLNFEAFQQPGVLGVDTEKLRRVMRVKPLNPECEQVVGLYRALVLTLSMKKARRS